MTLGRLSLSAATALTLVSAPIAAAAAPAERAAATTDGESLSGALAPAWIIAAVLIGALAVILITDDDEDLPTSP